MNIGFIGMGKLGLPCAVALGIKHQVYGYDIADHINSNAKPKDVLKTNEQQIENYWEDSSLTFVDTMEELVEKTNIIFIAVQTPHKKEYGGTKRLPETRKDFDYTWLCSACEQLSNTVEKLQVQRIAVIISTVLPGTIQKYIKPLLTEGISLCYNPFFIAMGNVISDFINPEFVLLGVDSQEAALRVELLYKTIHDKPIFRTTLENAELIKVLYNTFISTKILFANNIMELCDSTPNTNCDTVVDALSLATDRLISPAYLRGGMGDGGGCHPRDNIAMSWLSNTKRLSINLFDFIMDGREKQTEFLVKKILMCRQENLLPVCILGKSFKAETNLVDGSPAILLANILREHGIDPDFHDPHLVNDSTLLTVKETLSKPRIFFIGCKHNIFTTYKFPNGSFIIDPHRYIPKDPSINIEYIGIYTHQ